MKNETLVNKIIKWNLRIKTFYQLELSLKEL